MKKRIQVNGARVLVMGLAFKENCPDLRNTRVVDVIAELRDYGVEVDVHDPWVDAHEARAEYGLELVETPATGAYDGVILAVAHDEFRTGDPDSFVAWRKSASILCDLKSVLPVQASDLRL